MSDEILTQGSEGKVESMWLDLYLRVILPDRLNDIKRCNRDVILVDTVGKRVFTNSLEFRQSFDEQPLSNTYQLIHVTITDDFRKDWTDIVQTILSPPEQEDNQNGLFSYIRGYII